jgi:hypothetical protein
MPWRRSIASGRRPSVRIPKRVFKGKCAVELLGSSPLPTPHLKHTFKIYMLKKDLEKGSLLKRSMLKRSKLKKNI